VRAAYLRRAEQFPQRIRVIDGSRSIDAVRLQLTAVLASSLESLA
jgi:thymidylate kinase